MEVPNCSWCGDDLDYSVYNWGWYVEQDDPRFPSTNGAKYCMKCWLHRFPFLKVRFCDRYWQPNPHYEKRLIKREF